MRDDPSTASQYVSIGEQPKVYYFTNEDLVSLVMCKKHFPYHQGTCELLLCIGGDRRKRRPFKGILAWRAIQPLSFYKGAIGTSEHVQRTFRISPSFRSLRGGDKRQGGSFKGIWHVSFYKSSALHPLRATPTLTRILVRWPCLK